VPIEALMHGSCEGNSVLGRETVPCTNAGRGISAIRDQQNISSIMSIYIDLGTLPEAVKTVLVLIHARVTSTSRPRIFARNEQ